MRVSLRSFVREWFVPLRRAAFRAYFLARTLTLTVRRWGRGRRVLTGRLLKPLCCPRSPRAWFLVVQVNITSVTVGPSGRRCVRVGRTRLMLLIIVMVTPVTFQVVFSILLRPFVMTRLIILSLKIPVFKCCRFGRVIVPGVTWRRVPFRLIILLLRSIIWLRTRRLSPALS